ncbi:MAG: tetratricopeptide repeat protein [Planctomycetota bacterium]
MKFLRFEYGLGRSWCRFASLLVVLPVLSGCATTDPEPTDDERLAVEEQDRRTDTEELGVVAATRTAEAAFEPGEQSSDGRPGVTDRDRSISALWRTEAGVRELRDSQIPNSDIEPPINQKEVEILQEARLLMDQEQFAEAEALVDRYTNEAASAQLFMQLAVCQIAQERPLAALANLQFAVSDRKSPKFRRAWVKIAQIQSQAGNFIEARKAFTEVIKLGGQTAFNWGLLGVTELRLGHPIAAESAFRQAIALNPERPDWQIGLAEAFRMQRNWPQAIALYSRLIEDDPGRSKFWIERARAYNKSGQKLEAIRDLEVAVAMDGVEFSDLLLLAALYWKEGQLRPAVSTSLTALELDREAPIDTILLIAKAVVQGGDLEEARRLVDGIRVERGETLSPEEEKALYNIDLRIAISDGGGPAQAEALENIRRIDPLDGDAHLRLARYYELAGNFELAELRLQQASGLGDEWIVRANDALAGLYYRKGAGEGGTKADFSKALQALRRAQKAEFREDRVPFERRLERLSAGG